MGDTTEQSKANDVHEEPVNSENPDDPKEENVMVKLLAEIASLKEKVNSMGQNGPEAAPKGKNNNEPSTSKGNKGKSTQNGNAKPKNPARVDADTKMAEADAKMADPEDEEQDSVFDPIDNYLGSDEEDKNEEGEINDDSDEEKEWFKQLAEEYGEEEVTGLDVMPESAQLISQIVCRRLPAERENEILKKVNRPGNVPMLANPKVNPEIWQKMQPKTRGEDFKISRSGDKICKGMIGNAQLAAKLKGLKAKLRGEDKKTVRELARDAFDNIRIGTMALNEVNQMRRAQIREDLNPIYRSLCNPPKEEDGLLFGSDVTEKIKAINQSRNIGMMDKKSFLGGRIFQPYDNRRPQRGGHRPQVAQNPRHSCSNRTTVRAPGEEAAGRLRGGNSKESQNRNGKPFRYYCYRESPK